MSFPVSGNTAIVYHPAHSPELLPFLDDIEFPHTMSAADLEYPDFVASYREKAIAYLQFVQNHEHATPLDVQGAESYLAAVEAAIALSRTMQDQTLQLSNAMSIMAGKGPLPAGAKVEWHSVCITPSWGANYVPNQDQLPYPTDYFQKMTPELLYQLEEDEGLDHEGELEVRVIRMKSVFDGTYGVSAEGDATDDDYDEEEEEVYDDDEEDWEDGQEEVGQAAGEPSGEAQESEAAVDGEVVQDSH